MMGNDGLITALDVGTTKVCCLIAQSEGVRGLKVVGVGLHASEGVRAGDIVSMDASEAAIRAAVGTAERMAEDTVRDVHVNVSCGRPRSSLVGVEVAIAGHEVGDADLRRIVDHGRGDDTAAGRELVHAIPVNFSIDGSRGIRDPRGMSGQRLGASVHLVSALPAPLRNLATCIVRCHLQVVGRAVTPYASAIACLTDDEANLGAILIDMGGGTTSLAVLQQGEVVHTDLVAAGGGHVTNDIARGLSTPLAHAERMKTLYGSAMPSPNDERDMIDVPQIGEVEQVSANHVPRSMLVGIIRPRIEEIFELVRSRIEASGMAAIAGDRVVLTGGASQLQGVRDLAAQVLGRRVRVGRPLRPEALPAAVSGPAFSTAAGLLMHALRERSEPALRARARPVAGRGAIGRIGEWIREYL